MMNALIFETAEAALQEAAKVQIWARIHIHPNFVSLPVPYQEQWAVTVPPGYPLDDRPVTDINAVPEIEE
ncbi:MAG: hypothetical protein LLG06_19795 [Desulfobacteraceae bacterium]|nr:hypothetical protein [Desulfobacteraceae bacterium]